MGNLSSFESCRCCVGRRDVEGGEGRMRKHRDEGRGNTLTNEEIEREELGETRGRALEAHSRGRGLGEEIERSEGEIGTGDGRKGLRERQGYTEEKERKPNITEEGEEKHHHGNNKETRDDARDSHDLCVSPLYGRIRKNEEEYTQNNHYLSIPSFPHQDSPSFIHLPNKQRDRSWCCKESRSPTDTREAGETELFVDPTWTVTDLRNTEEGGGGETEERGVEMLRKRGGGGREKERWREEWRKTREWSEGSAEEMEVEAERWRDKIHSSDQPAEYLLRHCSPNSYITTTTTTTTTPTATTTYGLDRAGGADEEEEDSTSMNEEAWSGYLFGYHYFHDSNTTTTTTATPTSTTTATITGAIDNTVGGAGMGWGVRVGEHVSVGSEGLVLEAFGVRATVGASPSLTFLGHSLLQVFSGPD